MEQLVTDYYDALETRAPTEREADLFSRLPDVLRKAMAVPAYANASAASSLLQSPAGRISAPAAAAQIRTPCPPQGRPAVRGPRPGPSQFRWKVVYIAWTDLRAEATNADPWRGARALFAAGFRPGDVVLNTFSYHLTPGGFHLRWLRTRARLRGHSGRSGNTEAQFELIEAYRPVGYSGTPDFLKILLDAASNAGRDISSIKRALVSGAAFPKSLQEEIKSRGSRPTRRSVRRSRPYRV